MKQFTELKDMFKYMYYDLLSNRLDVVLVPSKYPAIAADGGCIRVAVTRNPTWYQSFCLRYKRNPLSKRKKPRTIIKRRETLSLLEGLMEGKDMKSKYLDHLTEIAKSLSEEMNLSHFDIEFFEMYGELPEPFTDQF